MKHDLKTETIYWDAVQRGEKLFEVRKNDRCFQAGDVVNLYRYDGAPTARCYTNQRGERSSYPIKDAVLTFCVGPVLQGGQFGIEPGYCVFSLFPHREGGAAEIERLDRAALGGEPTGERLAGINPKAHAHAREAMRPYITRTVGCFDEDLGSAASAAIAAYLAIAGAR